MTRRSPSPEAPADPTPTPESPTPPAADPTATSLLFSAPSSQSLPPIDLSSDPPSSPSSDESPSLHVGDVDSPSARPSIPAGDWRKRRRQLLEPTSAAVQTAGGIAHTILTAEGTPEREHGLYLPDDDDVKAIAEPLAGLASRRMPPGAENPDVTDLIALAVGLVGYVVKQINLRQQLRRLFHADPQTAPGPEDLGDPEQR